MTGVWVKHKENDRGETIRFTISIPYVLPETNLYRSGKIKPIWEQKSDRKIKREQQEIVFMLMKSSGELDRLASLDLYARTTNFPLFLQISYSRPKRGRRYDQDNAAFVVNKVAIDPLVKAKILKNDYYINYPRPKYLGTSDKPVLTLDFVVFPEEVNGDELEGNHAE